MTAAIKNAHTLLESNTTNTAAIDDCVQSLLSTWDALPVAERDEVRRAIGRWNTENPQQVHARRAWAELEAELHRRRTAHVKPVPFEDLFTARGQQAAKGRPPFDDLVLPPPRGR